MVKSYESLLLVRTEITDDELKAIEQNLNKVIAEHKGTITNFDKWGKYKLSYPVKKHVYGIYVLARFEAPQEVVQSLFKELDLLYRIKYNEIILRHVNIKLDGKAADAYKFPEPIGAHSAGGLDSFLKENKMGGLIETSVEGAATTNDLDEEEAADEINIEEKN